MVLMRSEVKIKKIEAYYLEIGSNAKKESY